ncbi:MAG TPA: GNAT family N-acetyltransferase [Bacillales bacterium]|nr:GNAT family N-acetyltransferase [Bacillales bacterium]
MISDFELMERHVKVLFRHDDENRITVINEPPYERAPRIFVGATRFGNIIRYSNKLDESLVDELGQVIGADPGVDPGKIVRILCAERPINHFWIGPAFLFPDTNDRPTKAIQITESNKALLKPNFPYTFDEFQYKQPCFAIVENEKAVSVCCSARQTDRAAEASLAIIEAYRGRAFAVDVSNAWAREVQKQGRMALYSTSWDNFASQSVARKLHLMQYGTDIHMS